MSPEYLLETRNLCKDFGGFSALGGVGLKVRRGSVHALIGPNGAGKTTCFNLITKFLEPTTGQIFYRGREITRMAAADIALYLTRIAAGGIGMSGSEGSRSQFYPSYL